ncbi:MAG: tyrosine decarboxylase MfnA [Candidatus Bathyarchaeia archaeon]
MLSSGLSKRQVLAELKKIRCLDQQYNDGKILCSMCTKSHPTAEKAYRLFLNSNLGDPGLFRGSVQLEKEVVNALTRLLHGENCVGHIVSGGTEANLTALLAAIKKASVRVPEVVLPESAHFSFTKICSILNLKPVYAGLDDSFKADPKQVEECIGENTVALVGTAGSSELGIVDPIEALSQIAARHNVWLHVDAAFGGLVIPFLADAQRPFDFGLEAVESMTVDPHKMGMAAIPAGGILFRHAEALNSLKTETPYLTDQFQNTFTGTRSGAAVASTWAAFRSIGFNGYRKIVGKCMKTTRFFADGLTERGCALVTKPTLNIVAFRSNNGSKRLAEKLREQGWFISYVPRYDCLRIVVMPHVKKQHAMAFLEDVAKIEKL